MRLTEDWLQAYAACRARTHKTTFRDELARLADAVASGDVDLRNVFVDVDVAAHRVRGFVRLVPVDRAMWLLTEWQGAPDASLESLLPLMREARTRAEALGATRVMTRINTDRFSEAYQQALVASGFCRHGGRIEYRTPVAALPAEGPSDLTWSTMREAGKGSVVETLRAASGDGPDALDGLDGDNPIEQLLHMPYADVDSRLVQQGALQGVPVCVLVLRVDPSSGWSTVAYLGVRPEYRGCGIGAQAHRHAFSVIRALGGTLYHDGTSDENHAMIRLFKAHGCIESERIEDWAWRAPC
jgi:GNAT superfamily N-acetyltransferase